MKIGIMGGTFDPPHLGHLLPVDEAASRYALDQVWFVPNCIPPHKAQPQLTDPFHRAAMVALAIQRYPRFLLDTVELHREQPAFTFDTIRELQNGAGKGHQLLFILGSDSFLELHSWHRYAELIELCEFIMINRGDEAEQLIHNLRRLEATLQKDLAQAFHFFRSVPIPISSTEVRAAVQDGRSISGMVPPEVEDYIQKHSLYRRRKMPSD